MNIPRRKENANCFQKAELSVEPSIEPSGEKHEFTLPSSNATELEAAITQGDNTLVVKPHKTLLESQINQLRSLKKTRLVFLSVGHAKTGPCMLKEVTIQPQTNSLASFTLERIPGFSWNGSPPSSPGGAALQISISEPSTNKTLSNDQSVSIPLIRNLLAVEIPRPIIEDLLTVGIPRPVNPSYPERYFDSLIKRWRWKGEPYTSEELAQLYYELELHKYELGLQEYKLKPQESVSIEQLTAQLLTSGEETTSWKANATPAQSTLTSGEEKISWEANTTPDQSTHLSIPG